MKTVLVVPCWLQDANYLAKTIKWLDYYERQCVDLKFNDIVLLENASSFSRMKHIKTASPRTLIQRFTEHMPRTGHLEYPYLWRADYFFKELFKEYDKIVYMDNDMYLISKKAVTLVNYFDSGWMSFYCPRHNFPETGIQVVTRDSKAYKDFVGDLTQEEFIKKYNGQTMETTLPLTNIIKDLNGDRHSETGTILQQRGWDFSMQVPLEMDIVYGS